MVTTTAPRPGHGAVGEGTHVQAPDGSEPGAPDAPGAGTEPALGYRPGLDGVRALALLAVLAFHHGWAGARGGYLGVSSFFTLSGFLITTLAVSEWQRTGRLSWRRFWERRARRLLPAALVTVTAVLVLQAWIELGSGPRFRGDVLAALGYGANWRLALAEGGYADLFVQPSPVVHFWSLAIEEQFYLAFPLAFAATMRLVGGLRRRGVAAALVGAATLVSFAAAWVSADRHGNDGIAYYGTHTRAGELLVGVWLALVLTPSLSPPRRPGAGPARLRGLDLAGTVALAGLAWLWHSVAIGDQRLFRGATAVNAVLTAVVVAAVARAGRFDRVLGLGPLRAVGRVSYAAYLVHWPIFLVLAPPRVGLTGAPLFAVRLAVTLAVAAVSYMAIEAPFRFRLAMPRPRLAAVAVATAAAVVGLAAVLPQHPGAYADLAAAQPAGGASAGLRPATDVRMTAVVAPPDGRPATYTVLLAGDSVAYSIRTGFHFWNTRGPEQAFQVDSHISFGCPVGGPGVVRGVDEHRTPPDCETWHRDLPAALAASAPDAVVMLMGLLDLNGREIDGEWRELGDPVHDAWLRSQLDEVATLLDAQGVTVVWLTFPHVRTRDVADPTRAWDTIPINEPSKVDRFNALLAEVVADHDRIQLVDFAGWLETWPNHSFDPDMRDGVHFSYAGSDKVGAWLIPQLLAMLGA